MSKRTSSVASRPFRLAAAMLGILIPSLWLVSTVTPSDEAVKLRNALLADMGTIEDFNWTPETVPDSFRVETGGPDDYFKGRAAELLGGIADKSASDFDKGLAISRRLLQSGERGGAIMSDNAEAYREITEQGRGYCGDYTQVFNALALATGMPVREWGIAFDAFGSGHAFNEVYDRNRGKWILVDSFHSLYFVDPQDEEPLSVLEVHDRLLGIDPRGEVRVVPIVADEFAFRSEAVALDYYRRGMRQLFLWWGNNVFDYERHRLIGWVGKVSRSLQQATAIVVGVHPKILIYPKGVSTRNVNDLFQAWRDFLLAAAAFAIACLVFGLQILAIMRETRSPGPPA